MCVCVCLCVHVCQRNFLRCAVGEAMLGRHATEVQWRDVLRCCSALARASVPRETAEAAKQLVVLLSASDAAMSPRLVNRAGGRAHGFVTFNGGTRDGDLTDVLPRRRVSVRAASVGDTAAEAADAASGGSGTALGVDMSGRGVKRRALAPVSRRTKRLRDA